MCFYGTLGLLLGLYIGLIILWDLGEGFNEFNLETGQVRIFRWGFPGKNRPRYKVGGGSRCGCATRADF